ncbi:MAG TPA: UvrD-helicase domain-containing protein [Candidatus Angelobacter sp.]
MEKAAPRDYDGLEAIFIVWTCDGWYDRLRDPRKGKAKFSETVKRDEILALNAELMDAIASLERDGNSDLAFLLQGELAETVTEYEKLKLRAGVLDYLDLLILTRDLLLQSRSVGEHFQRRFTHLFIDEFQDTDPLQAEILILLSADNADVSAWRAVKPSAGKLFIVGDPKQAIYRFRRADVGTYEQVKRLLLANGAELLQLTPSFRSLRSIQNMINRAFKPLMTGDTEKLQADYVPLSPFHEEYSLQPSIVALPVPRPYKTRFSMMAVEESLPDAIAAFISWLVKESGWTVPNPGNPAERIPLGPNHVCLLFRRFTSFDEDVARPYVRVLEARNLPHLLVGGRSFHDPEEV